MVSDTHPILRHQIDFMLHNLPSGTVRIEFPAAAGAENVMLTTVPTIQLGASYADAPALVSNLFVQPRRIQFDVTSPPALLPVTLQIKCSSPFIFGWLQVPENIQTTVATVVERIRIVGSSYWALPLGEGVAEPGRKSSPEKSEKSVPATKIAERAPLRPASAPAAKPVETAPEGASASAKGAQERGAS
ncbi:hypothetical protein ACMGDH_11190 [Sphingomonas sp. DT-207]|uniref:hypothetical protein n=1 Tax=Sphingomonas sp. DT-207 TaxID=3396167 RepID=UPI003F19F777